ncbi:MAG: hypothetical protein ACR2H0_05715 [Candidatus Limnocylindrales bacterium]
MAYNRRQQRRQGIVYGPAREKSRYSDNGVLIGRFLGLGILLLTLGVLAAGAVAFMGDRGAIPSSSPVRSAPAGLATASAATNQPTTNPTTLPTMTPVGSIAPSVGPTSVPPLVQIGEGFVTFGTRSDDQLHILDPRSTFGIDERIVWSAFLTARADSVDLLIRILKMDNTAIGGERLISEEAVTPVVVGAQIFQDRIRPQVALDGSGIYVVRYLRGEVVLSEGFVEITSQ